MVSDVGDLPDDVLADNVLRRLPPRSLAACRCVSRCWREAVDARRLLRADLLPRAVGGIFIEYCLLFRPEFLRRPFAAHPPVSASLDFMPSVRRVLDHCDGLLLCEWYEDALYVANPATRRFALLPPCPVAPPRPGDPSDHALCLVYDPAESPQHYEVFAVPLVPDGKHLDAETLRSEWPPSSCTMPVFSSETGRWQERPFARQGEAAGTVAYLSSGCGADVPCRAYWRGALYVRCCCDDNSILRISLADAKYQVVKTPTHRFYLGRSQKGVYCAEGYQHSPELWIWFLDESNGRMEWVLKHRADPATFGRKLHACVELGDDQQPRGPWVLDDINHDRQQPLQTDDDTLEWNSDDDSVPDTDDTIEGRYNGDTTFLGFHPYREIFFLGVSLRRAVAYHWNTTKVENLGNIFPEEYDMKAQLWADIEKSFVYTPCWVEEFPGTN